MNHRVTWNADGEEFLTSHGDSGRCVVAPSGGPKCRVSKAADTGAASELATGCPGSGKHVRISLMGLAAACFWPKATANLVDCSFSREYRITAAESGA